MCYSRIKAVLVLLSVFGYAQVASSQALSPNFAGQGIRDRNRAMDDYDRTINRMKNDAKAVNQRRRDLFPQINEDFQRIQVIHNEMVRMLQPDKGLNYNRLAELGDDLKKRSSRLRTNLALSEPEKTDSQRPHAKELDDNHMRVDIADLHDLVASFVASPIFKNIAVVDSKVIDSASENLNNIIDMSDEIKKEAKLLGKSKKE